MHRISRKPSHIDPMVIEHMAIEAIVMPNFQIALALKIVLEVVDQPCILAEVVDEDPRSSAEIQLWPREEAGADNLPLPHRRLLLDIQIHSLSIPSSYGSRPHQNLNTLLALLFGGHNVDTGQLLLLLSTQSSRRICMLLDYLEILVEEFTGVFLIEAVGTGTADFGGYAEDFV